MVLILFDSVDLAEMPLNTAGLTKAVDLELASRMMDSSESQAVMVGMLASGKLSPNYGTRYVFNWYSIVMGIFP